MFRKRKRSFFLNYFEFPTMKFFLSIGFGRLSLGLLYANNYFHFVLKWLNKLKCPFREKKSIYTVPLMKKVVLTSRKELETPIRSWWKISIFFPQQINNCCSVTELLCRKWNGRKWKSTKLYLMRHLVRSTECVLHTFKF